MTAAAIVAFGAVVVTWVALVWGALSRKAGRLRSAWGWWALSVASLGATIAVASTVRDQAPLGRLPVLVPLVMSMALIGWGIWRATRTAPTADDAPHLSPQGWFDRLTGLLRGRYYLPRAAVRRHVAQAQSHWRDSGTAHPREEFGSPAVYAFDLLDGMPEPKAGRRLARAWSYTAMAAFWAFSAAAGALDGDSTWSVASRGAICLALTIVAVNAWRRTSATPRGTAGAIDGISWER